MKSTILFAFLFFTASLIAQQVKLKKGEETTTESGLKIKLTEAGKGKSISKGDKVKVHYTGTLVDERLFDSSRERDQPFEFVVGMKQVIAGWDEALPYLKVGDRAILTVPPDLGYGDTPMPKIPTGSYLVFDIEVLDVFKDFAPKQFVVKEKNSVTTETGLTFNIVEEGKGTKAEKGKTVEVHYTGFLENGDIFDSSVLRGKPISFRLGAGMVIPGWDEGISYMSEGSKALLSIPYELAYGENGRPPLIPAKSRLLFNVELISVK
ncbi:MAG: FKBP-type peptidyl-prolyl cis-trans isomerase [Bacteroidia bacterium]